MTEDFIRIYDNVLSPAECQSMINYYKDMASLNLNIDFKRYTNGLNTERKDETVFMFEPESFSIHATHSTIETFIPRFWTHYQEYTEEFGSLRDTKKHGIQYMRVQKTLPGQGFHKWHYESDSVENCARIVTFMIFLNDVEDGGETEFLYLHKRVKPKAGRLIIWPAGYPHTHRGNPPLSGEKYIITGWLNLLE